MGVRPLVRIVSGFALVAALLGFAPTASAAGSGVFDPTGPMSTPRVGAAAAPLPDGGVLVAGGASAPGVAPHGCSSDQSSAEIFDPVTGTFSRTGIGAMSVRRAGAVAAPLPDGRVLVAGGGYCYVAPPYGMPTGQDLSSAEIFDPATNTFSSAGIVSMSTPRSGAIAAPLPDGRVLVAGGFDGASQLSSAEVFDPATNSFSSAGIGSMTVPRSGAVAAPLPGGRVLVAGGSDGASPLSSAEVFDPATNSFSSAGIGSMTDPRSGAADAAAPLPDGRVLITAGSGSAEVFNPATNTFSSAGIGSMSVPRGGAVAAPLPDGRVLVAGGANGLQGLNGNPYVSSAEVFSQVSCRGKPATIIGSGGADRISGTRKADVIIGGGGDDRISGYNGNDVICGGQGNDQVYGMKGADKLYGNAGNDVVKGGPGKDVLKGGAGTDRLRGGPGKDRQTQ